MVHSLKKQALMKMFIGPSFNLEQKTLSPLISQNDITIWIGTAHSILQNLKGKFGFYVVTYFSIVSLLHSLEKQTGVPAQKLGNGAGAKVIVAT